VKILDEIEGETEERPRLESSLSSNCYFPICPIVKHPTKRHNVQCEPLSRNSEGNRLQVKNARR